MTSPSSAPDNLPRRHARPWLGTLVEISAQGAEADLAIAAGFAAVAEVHALMSFHADDSDVARINRSLPGQTLTIAPLTTAVLAFSLHLQQRSQGCFNVAIADVLVRHGMLPGADIAEEALDCPLVLLPGDRVRRVGPGRIDLGGVAKGHAVDAAIDAMRAFAVESAMVNAGGDMRCFGVPQPVHVRHPQAPGLLVALGVLTDAALATSSGYHARREDVALAPEPLVDPVSRSCMGWGMSVSVIADTCMVADALTKVVRLNPALSLTLLDAYAARAIVIDEEGLRSAGASQGFRES